VTEGKTSEIKVARTLRFAPGTILAIDRGYNDYEWFRELTQEEGLDYVHRFQCVEGGQIANLARSDRRWTFGKGSDLPQERYLVF
jgi:hypothetical protein